MSVKVTRVRKYQNFIISLLFHFNFILTSILLARHWNLQRRSSKNQLFLKVEHEIPWDAQRY